MTLNKHKFSVKVLDTVVGDDDEDAEAWYLLAFSNFHLKKLKNAKECIKNVFTVAEKTKNDDAELKAGAEELKEKIYDALRKKGEGSDQEDQDMEEDHKENDGYETLSEEDVSSDEELRDNEMKTD
jgi:hypothetical protein